MASVFDVAAMILGKRGEMTAMKLHKLVYYAQAWALVWDEKPLFAERIEAWANGPVVPKLYQWHRGKYSLAECEPGNAVKLDPDEVKTVRAVLKYYGGRSGQWLGDLTHKEDPWRKAREGLELGQRGNREITHAAMGEYYGGLI